MPDVKPPKIALIVPSLAGGAPGLETDAKSQTFPPDEVIVIDGVRPNGRARNVGARRSDAALFVFVDDDARLGDAHVIENLVRPLIEDETIGITGSAKLLPPDAPAFQKRVAREVPRIEHPVIETPLETNPPLDRHGYCEITTTCAAMRREVWERAEGFDEKLVRGVDPDFFRRVRRLGYRLVLVPHTWVWHPAPANLRALLRKHFYYGVGFSQEVRGDPPRGGKRYLHTPFHAAAYLLVRLAWVVPSTFIPWSFSDPRPRLSFRPIGALASFASAVGYVWGWYFDAPKE